MIFLFSFVWQGHKALNVWDDSFLWYGMQRLRADEAPIPDFMTYDPLGRRTRSRLRAQPRVVRRSRQPGRDGMVTHWHGQRRWRIAKAAVLFGRRRIGFYANRGLVAVDSGLRCRRPGERATPVRAKLHQLATADAMALDLGFPGPAHRPLGTWRTDGHGLHRPVGIWSGGACRSVRLTGDAQVRTTCPVGLRVPGSALCAPYPLPCRRRLSRPRHLSALDRLLCAACIRAARLRCSLGLALRVAASIRCRSST